MTSIKTNSYLVLAVVLGLLAAPSASASAKPPFQDGCRTLISINYAAPLEKLPPIHHPPPYGKWLPFAPHGVWLYVAVPRVLVGQATVSFKLGQRGESSRLGWTVVSALSRMRRSGAVAEVIRSKRQHVDHIDPVHPDSSTFSFPVSGHPAIYRLTSTFFDATGRRLGTYSEYFRVLKHRADYHQSVSPQMAHGGDILISRTEDPGTTGLEFGNDFAIDHFIDGEWKLDPITPKGFAGISIFIFGGVTLECRIMRLPIDMAPGHYRFRKKVEVFFHKPRTIAADFFVLP